MKNNILILDYDLAFTADSGWAKIQLFGQPIDFTFTQYDAVTTAIDLGLIQEPDDRDKNRVGYEKSAFSAIVREVLPWESRVQYQENAEILREFTGTKFAEHIVQKLALRAPEVRAAIQAEAERIALHECPAAVVNANQIFYWFAKEQEAFPIHIVDWVEISDRKKTLWYAAEAEKTLNQL